MRFFLLAFLLQIISWVPIQSQNIFSIAQIQGVSTTSPLLNDQVMVSEAIVTAVHEDILYVQSMTEDNNPKSSEGILVLWNDANDFSKNDIVQIIGTVREINDNTSIQAQSIIRIGQTNMGLSPIAIDDNFPGSELQSINPLEFAEGQLVSFTNLSIVAPSDGGSLAYISGSNTRPLREPGIEFPGSAGLPVWDGNPEVFFFVPNGLGLASNAFLNANMKISGRGIIVQEEFNYALYPITFTIVEDNAPAPTDLPLENEFNIGCLNTLFLEREESSYELRLEKVANYIIDVLRSPDIIALQEVGGEQEFEDLAALLTELTGRAYESFSINPTGSINNGYIVHSTFTVQNIEALGTNLTFDGGGLHDRPPLLLEGFINTEDGQTALSVLNLHQRSLNGITGNGSDFVRRKRNAQAISVAQMVRNLQDEDKRIVVVGDFNAFQFSDGYVDVVNQIAGTESIGAEFPVSPQGIEPLINVSATFPPEENQYSFVFRGNAQILDHCLVSDFQDINVSNFHFGRGNADYPDSMLELDSPFRATDHDGFSLYLDLNSRVIEGEPIVINDAEIFVPNPFRPSDQITFNIEEKQNVTAELFNAAGQYLFEVALGAVENDQVPLPYTENLVAGVYFLRLTGRSIDTTEKLVIINR